VRIPVQTLRVHANLQAVEEDPQAERRRLLGRIAELERDKAALDRFAADAAHELLTPLVMIDAYAATALERLHDELDADSVSDLDALRLAAARSRQLVQTLLEHARSRRRPLERRDVEVDALVREALTLLAPEIRARGVAVEVGELPRVEADVTLIVAVFTNLLTNALKFGPREGAKIRVVARQDPDGWRFVIQSQGRAIAAEDAERIFEPYRRGRDERRTRGTGLGLAICREIVVWHGGRMGVESAEGGRNAFWFTLPA
jgi:signal transduction histidine kinase